jgi:hypothetical protein
MANKRSLLTYGKVLWTYATCVYSITKLANGSNWKYSKLKSLEFIFQFYLPSTMQQYQDLKIKSF